MRGEEGEMRGEDRDTHEMGEFQILEIQKGRFLVIENTLEDCAECFEAVS